MCVWCYCCRSDQPHVEHEAKPFDWTFTTDYSGTLLGGLKAEPSDIHIDLEKLKRREQILFYSDVTLFEDELHDNGTAICSVKIVSNCSQSLKSSTAMKIHIELIL